MFGLQRTEQRVRERNRNSLHSPGPDFQECQGCPGHVFESSLYTAASTHPKATRLALLGTGIALAAFWQLRRQNPIFPLLKASRAPGRKLIAQ